MFNLFVGLAETIIMISIILIFVLFLWVYNISIDLKELDKNVSDICHEIQLNGTMLQKHIDEINLKSKNFVSYALLIRKIDVSKIENDIIDYHKCVLEVSDELETLYSELERQSNDPENLRIYNSIKELYQEHNSLIIKYNNIANKLNTKLSIFPTGILGKILKISMKEEVE